jgi:iron-sulfur cluster assembly protein
MITVTEQAYKKILNYIQRRGHGVGIRVGVKTTGCSGLAYVLEYVDTYEPDEATINYAQKDFVVLVDKKHEPYLKGMVVNFARNGLNEGFEFRNPNERDRCGCGESFRV